MGLVRFLVPFVMAAGVTFGLFYLMQSLIGVEGEIDDLLADIVGDAVPHPAGTAGSVLKAGLAKRQATVVPPIERGSRNTQLVQRAADRQVGAFNQPDDLQLL